MDNHVYSVPIEYYDLRPAETYNQIFDTLEHLGKVVDDMFSRIAERVNDERVRLDSLSQRLGDAQAKIACLSNSKKATTVFSPARYPEVQTIKDTLIFSRTALLTNDEIVKRERKYGIMSDIPHEHDTPSFDIEYQKSSAENFQLFMDCNEHEHKKILPNEGLGKLPDLSSVSDFILFNTGETPYQKYDAYDNLSGWWIGKAGTVLEQGQEEAEKQRQEAAKKHLEEAPETIEKGEEMQQYNAYDVGYRPVIEDLPDLNLPANLPELSNIADIEWQPAQDGSIAPSVTLQPLPDADSLPNNQSNFVPAPRIDPLSKRVNDAVAEAYGLPAVSQSSTPSAASTPMASAEPPVDYASASVPVAPPPPPAPPAPPFVDASAPIATFADAPPAPPPPPPSLSPPPAASPSLPAISDARSSLLEEIRKGKKLKSAKTADESKDGDGDGDGTQAAAKPAAKNDGDMFTQLFAAIARRREVMKDDSDDEGKKKKTKDDSDDDWSS